MSAVPSADLEYGVTETLQAGATATGNGTPIDLTGCTYLAVDVFFSGSGVVVFEGTIERGGAWQVFRLRNTATGAYAAAPGTSGFFVLPADAQPLVQFRSRIAAYTSGTVDVKSRKQARVAR